jgi:hypothetical protein
MLGSRTKTSALSDVGKIGKYEPPYLIKIDIAVDNNSTLKINPV